MIMRKLLPWLMAPVYYLWARTLRIHFTGENAFRDPVVFLFWHNRLFPLIFTHRRRRVVVMVSTHRDGQMVARLLSLFGFGLARGSATRGGASALRSVLSGVKQGHSVAITPDGPTGPAFQFKEAAWKTARALGVPVMFVGLAYSAFWKLNSWDGFMIPKPFARVVVHLDRCDDLGISAQEAGQKLHLANKRAEDVLFQLSQK